MTFLLNWKYSPQFSATWDDSIGPQDFHTYLDPRSTQSVACFNSTFQFFLAH
jgi:hypothetical protein